jgi:hypothetical protein
MPLLWRTVKHQSGRDHMSEIIIESPHRCEEMKKEEIRLRVERILANYSVRLVNGTWHLHNIGYSWGLPLKRCPFCQHILAKNQVEIT